MRKSQNHERGLFQETLTLGFSDASISLPVFPSVASTVVLFCTTSSPRLACSRPERHWITFLLRTGRCAIQMTRAISFNAWGNPNTTMRKTNKAASTQDAINAWAPGVRLALVPTKIPIHQHVHTNFINHAEIREGPEKIAQLTWAIIGRVSGRELTGQRFVTRGLATVSNTGVTY